MEKQLGRTLQLQNYQSLSSLRRQTDKAFHNFVHQFPNREREEKKDK